MRKHCEDFGIVSNIEWDDDKRIYGKAWGKFLGDCQVVLGVESAILILTVTTKLGWRTWSPIQMRLISSLDRQFWEILKKSH